MAADVYEQAQAYLATNNPDKAKGVLRTALALNPLDGAAHLLSSQAEAMAGDLVAAEKHARAAAADAETRGDGFHALARVLGFDPARRAEAVEAATAAVQADPAAWRYRTTLAAALVDARNLPAAREQAEAAVRLAPADPDERARALVATARVFLADPQNRARGYDMVREAAAIDPTDSALQQQVMLAQFATGRRTDALRTALGTLRLTPTASVPPLIARFSVYFLLRRVLGWLLLTAFAVAILILGVVGNLGEPSLLERDPGPLVRIGSLVGLAAFASVLLLVFRPLQNLRTLRMVVRLSRRSALFWFGVGIVGACLLSYLLGVALGALFFPAVPLPVSLLLLGWIVHSFGAFTLRVPPPADLLRSARG
ncbi:tetratricopeptide repeat protein [Microbacterium sp. RD1]|uniref:tetratricopeptide repeat protein n=1 Tax=Microbacterium sp. RD1 TaxID=3457313 RepID=UPI003FA5F4BA